MNMDMEQESYKVDSCVRQFHIYKDCWVPAIGETCPFHLTMMLFRQFCSLQSFPWLVDRDETRPKQVFSSSPLTLKKLGIVTKLTCFFFGVN